MSSHENQDERPWRDEAMKWVAMKWSDHNKLLN
jgi:hypothetical protein